MNFTFSADSIKPLEISAPTVTTSLSRSDYWGAVKVRWGIGRSDYRVEPGLYKAGKPGRESDVLISANYKLSFDVLRKSLKGLNVWILVIDTKGVNVWCAAGKGTFGTANLVKSIKELSLDLIVSHRRIIVPQLGATGVAAHKVKEQTGFRVVFGPVHASDIKRFIDSGYKATVEMRKIEFPMRERAKLIPVDLMYAKYKLLVIAGLLFFLSGIDRSGFLFVNMIDSGAFVVLNIVSAYLAGIVLAPLFLPYVPSRAFALKGAFWGIAITLVLNILFEVAILEGIALGMINASIASFMTMNFTGSSTYTSLSGVKMEMKWAIPFQIAIASIGLILFIASKLILS